MRTNPYLSHPFRLKPSLLSTGLVGTLLWQHCATQKRDTVPKRQESRLPQTRAKCAFNDYVIVGKSHAGVTTGPGERSLFVGAANQPECKEMDMTGQKVEWCVQRSR